MDSVDSAAPAFLREQRPHRVCAEGRTACIPRHGRQTPEPHGIIARRRAGHFLCLHVVNDGRDLPRVERPLLKRAIARERRRRHGPNITRKPQGVHGRAKSPEQKRIIATMQDGTSRTVPPSATRRSLLSTTSGRRRRGMRPDDDQACGPGGRAPSPATRKPRAPAHPRRRVGRVAGTRTTQGPLVSISRLPGPADADARTEARAEARRHQRIAVAHRGRWPELERRHLSFGPFSTVTDERDGSVYAINRARSTSTPATSPPTTSPSTVIPSSSRSGRADDPQGRHPDRPDRDPRPLPHRPDQARPRAVAHPCAPARTPTRSCSSTTSQTK